jgi:flagellar basal body-associated protein FliL
LLLQIFWIVIIVGIVIAIPSIATTVMLNGRENALAQQQQQEQQQRQQQYQQFAFQKTSSYIDRNNIMHVYGLIKNISNKATKNVVVKASFYDSNSKMIN